MQILMQLTYASWTQNFGSIWADNFHLVGILVVVDVICWGDKRLVGYLAAMIRGKTWAKFTQGVQVSRVIYFGDLVTIRDWSARLWWIIMVE